MTDTAKLETLLGSEGEVRLGRREVQDVLQKLRARGAASDSADRLEAQLAHSDEVVIAPNEAQALLEELRASGRRWISGTDEPREEPPPPAPAPEPEPEPEPERRGGFRRFWRR
ncbi:MAG TPA: hypothetical protein VIM23_12130 [Gaiellaceae bacterium]